MGLMGGWKGIAGEPYGAHGSGPGVITTGGCGGSLGGTTTVTGLYTCCCGCSNGCGKDGYGCMNGCGNTGPGIGCGQGGGQKQGTGMGTA